jgi:hypothetical protein
MLEERPRPNGMLGAVSGSVSAEWAAGKCDIGRDLALPAPMATDLARCSREVPGAVSFGGGGGRSLSTFPPGLKSDDWSRMASKSLCWSSRSMILLIYKVKALFSALALFNSDSRCR